MRPTRRAFLKLGAATAIASATRFRKAEAADASTGAIPLDQFGYHEIELLDGPMRQQFEANHALFLALDDDMLLKPFRQRAGQPAPGDDMGGWYDNSPEFDPHGTFHGFIPGHSFGQYLSGLARAYAVTGSQPTRDKVRRLVRAFAPTITTKFYDGYHLPAYTFDKSACGLIDAHEFAGDEMAFKVLDAATDAVLPHLPPKAMSRAEQYAIPRRTRPIAGTKPTRCPRICSSPIIAGPAIATTISRSGSWKTIPISILCRRGRTFFRASTLTATSTPSQAPCRRI